jgi:predicted RND superfamily exporter protein
VASPSVVYVAMLDQIKADGLRMIAIALVVVFLILTFAFRGPHRALIALTPLLIGVVWMLGAAAFLGIKLDFFNVIVLPVVLGIGIDDGVHFYHHFRESGSVSETMSRVGMSVTMTSITSMIGFGGLAVTDYAGLKTIGHLAICGIATTWLATLFVLPPLLALLQRRSAASAAE